MAWKSRIWRGRTLATLTLVTPKASPAVTPMSAKRMPSREAMFVLPPAKDPHAIAPDAAEEQEIPHLEGDRDAGDPLAVPGKDHGSAPCVGIDLPDGPAGRRVSGPGMRRWRAPEDRRWP